MKALKTDADARVPGDCGYHLNLSGTYLRWADLRGADFSFADFKGSDFANANLKGTVLRGADLSGARNLTPEQVQEAVIDDATVLPDDIKAALNGAREHG
ncbi:MAG: pentapeptide repeat-containing protein [Geminicoccaceae bacterium]|nr:pentapeptide repeat-containing protein [Geminicoccaceae bacterium]